jgi:imidazole glycerol-phosphate synthase subunit HisH
MRHSLKAVIIDYGSGNLHSAKKAFVKAMSDIGAQGSVLVSNNPKDLDTATHIVLPGVGAFGDCIAGLKSSKGLVEKLEEQVLQNKKPFLGICVGMQMLAEKGFEDGEHKGLGWIKGDVVKIAPRAGLRIPQMGWNNLRFNKKSKLLNGVAENSDVYFVHSYYMKTDNDNIVADTNYGDDITAIVEKDNIYGVQFHPEKSQQIGLKIISNFLLV